MWLIVSSGFSLESVNKYGKVCSFSGEVWSNWENTT